MNKVKQNPIRQKSFDFALRVIKVCNILKSEKEYILSNQLLRSGTSVGAMIREAEHAESRADFIHKLSVSLKEANESQYWLELLYASEMIGRDSFDSLFDESDQIISILISIIKKLKGINK